MSHDWMLTLVEAAGGPKGDGLKKQIERAPGGSTLLNWARSSESPRARSYSPVNLQVAVGEPIIGRQAILKDLRAFFHAFPDNYTNIENLFEEGEWAILEWSGGGTSRGNFAGRSVNGRSYKLQGTDFSTSRTAKFVFSVGTGIRKHGSANWGFL